jgi:hypothetical protein
MDFDKPIDTIAEIAIIGTGGGYGESCVIHLGMQKWLVVDSCINPRTKKSLPLQYLEDIGVDVNSEVVLILCTHWHDDYILGISQLLEKCPQSKFSFAKANDKNKFLRMVSNDYEKSFKGTTNSSTKEFIKCLEILELRKSNPIMSYPDRILATVGVNGFNNQVISLSHSDSAIHNFDLEISTLITEFGKSNRRIVALSPNFNSVSLFMKLGHHRAILGGDLEVSTSDNSIGWDDIVNNSQAIDKRSAFFKIPHHGSENAFHEKLWTEKLSDKAKTGLTPWNIGSKLPTKKMIEVYKYKSDELYLTSTFFKNGKPKKRDKTINKMIQDFKIELEEIPFEYGIIRARIQMNDAKSEWSIECFGTASRQ